MVKIALPPPSSRPNPVFHTLTANTALYRLFDPTRHNTTALSFRYFGPLLQFDHHRSPTGLPMPDVDRGVYYAGFTLSCCIVEVFGDTGLIECGDWHVAMPRVVRDIRLLDLRGSGALRAGSVAALGKVADRPLSQAWARHFYDERLYGQTEGLLWYNAHNDEEALSLYERAIDAIQCPPDRIMRLDDPLLIPTLEQIAEMNNLILVP